MKKPSKHFGKPICVVWEDAFSIDEWTDLKELVDEPALIQSVGYLLYENDKRLALALNIDEEHETASCIMIIPRKMIKQKFYLDK